MGNLCVLIKPVSGQCNMKCEYCFYADETAKRQRKSLECMSEETLENIVRKTLGFADGVISFVFQGGEPVLRGLKFYEKFVEMQKKYNKKHVVIQNALQTNASLLNEEWCIFLKENHFLVGVSVDGCKKTHDAYRKTTAGADTFDVVCQKTKLLERYQIDFNILTVVSEMVAENIEDIYALYKQNSWKYQQYISCKEPLDKEWGKGKYSLQPLTYGMFLTKLFELWFKDWQKGEQPYIRQFDNYIGILKGYLPEACEQCGFCNIYYAVEADGSVYPCDFYMLDDFCMGNFNVDTVEKIWRNGRESKLIRRSEKVTEECRKCSCYYLCRGGCQRDRVLRIDGTCQNYYCEGYRYFFEHCAAKLQSMCE